MICRMRQKVKSPHGHLLQPRLYGTRAHGPQGRGYRLEAVSQYDAQIMALDVGRRFVVVVFRLPPMSGVCPNVGIGMLISLVVDFNPIATEMGPGTTRHPYNVFSAFCIVTCLGCWLDIEIQLSRLIRLGPRVRDRRLDRAIHKQCHPVNARFQSL